MCVQAIRETTDRSPTYLILAFAVKMSQPNSIASSDPVALPHPSRHQNTANGKSGLWKLFPESVRSIFRHIKEKVRSKWRLPRRKPDSGSATMYAAVAHTPPDVDTNRHTGFFRIIAVAVDINGKENCRSAKALFDTGIPDNLMSLGFANHFREGIVPLESEYKLEGLGGNECPAHGRIVGRWAPRDDSDEELAIDPKFYHSTWYITSHPDARYDILIGRKTIKAENLFPGPRFGGAGFRGRRTHFSSQSPIIHFLFGLW